MNVPTSKPQLLEAFGARRPVTVELRTNDGPVTVTGTIVMLEHEDGSGKSFNAKVATDSGSYIEGYLGRFA